MEVVKNLTKVSSNPTKPKPDGGTLLSPKDEMYYQDDSWNININDQNMSITGHF